MRPGIGIIAVIVLLAAAQGSFAHRMAIAGVKPDLLIICTVIVGLRLGPIAGTLAGALAGLAHASMAGFGLGSFVFSRTMTGYLSGSARARVFCDNPAAPLIGAAIGTLAAELLFIVFNPPPRLAAWLAPLPLIALYNGLLALPISWGIGKILGPRQSATSQPSSLAS